MGVFKSKLNVLALIFFIASVLFVLYTILFNENGNKDKNNAKFNYTKDEVAIYMSDEYAVLDYNTFYTIENISKQIISALSEGKYKELYKVLSPELAGDISKEQYESVFSEYYISNFADIKDNEGNITERYQNSRNLKAVYSLGQNGVYIAELVNNHNSTSKIGIRITASNTYQIVYFEI